MAKKLTREQRLALGEGMARGLLKVLPDDVAVVSTLSEDGCTLQITPIQDTGWRPGAEGGDD